MRCVLKNHPFEHEIQTIAQIFYPNDSYEPSPSVPQKGVAVESELDEGQDLAIGRLYINGSLVAEISRALGGGRDGKELRHALMTALFCACKEYTGIRTPWGSLTGIRPSKPARLMMESGMSAKDVVGVMTARYLAEEDKIRLVTAVAATESRVLAEQKFDGRSLYIGIPFCPTRCLYCSFTSFARGKDKVRKDGKNGGKVKAYMAALYKELAYLRKYYANRPLEALYIGGGTPTSLTEDELRELLSFIRENFPVPEEFTVEAGRPDSLNREKLRILKEFGVDRISVNPQTFCDETLVRVGRRHTSDDIRAAFAMAREEGHTNINADIILGLPGENAEHTRRTMEELAKLRPESVTVHTLAVKRASALNETLNEYEMTPTDEMEKMLDISRKGCENMGLIPYYLYRQKNMVGNFENVGYCLPGCESRYNVYIMEETQTIWAAGAGAASKLVFDNNRIERVFNVKNLDDYISRIDEMIERKESKHIC